VPFAKEKGITYPLLNDPGSVIIREYGILNTQMAPDHELFGIPFPGTFVLDPGGRVISRFFEESYRTRLTGRGLVLQLGGEPEGMPDPSETVAGGHLDLGIEVSDPVVAPGQEFLLTFEVTLPPGIHVYAPGDHPYRVIGFHLEETDSLFSLREPIYPESVDYHFEPMDEHTPVFEGSFRIQQPVVIEATRDLAARSKEPDATVTLAGTLEYQACDDRVCFIPDSVPVQVTLGLRPLEPGVPR
jgi:hypothetical protein